MFKKFLALFLALLTIAFAVTACNESGDDSAQTTGNTTAENTTAATTTAATTTAATTAATTEPVDIRMVSFNLANYIPIQNRLPKFFNLIELFEADILMFQETVGQYNWHDAIDTRLLNDYGYAEASDSSIEHNQNWNPIYYNQDKFELVSAQYRKFSEPKTDPRTYTVAEFKEKETSKTFTCICSHFSTDPEMRITNEKELATFITVYKSKHNNTPIFLMGDLNAEKDQLSSQLTKVMTHALDMEGIVTKDTEYGTSCAVTGVWPGNWLRKDGFMIDHALATGKGYVGKQFEVVASATAAATSDHVPVIFDFALT